jgi:hypothetical protein
MNRARWFALVVALQAAFLLGWAGYCEWSRAGAPTILLQTRPVDPRDLLRGDYMILNYEISRVPLPAGSAPEAAVPGREIWITLRRGARFHECAGTAWAEPGGASAPGAGGRDEVVVRGRVRGRPFPAQREVTVDYGIEKYFVPEGKGQPIFKEMVVEATVSSSGALGIKRVLLDGRTYP